MRPMSMNILAWQLKVVLLNLEMKISDQTGFFRRIGRYQVPISGEKKITLNTLPNTQRKYL